MFDLLEDLNQAQRDAVTSTEGFVRVIAGAGSGKTRALSHRFAYLVNELGILPGNILCVTFTNKAANEMRQRIHRLTGDNDTGYINTFHGFCVSILQEDSFVVQYPKSFLVLDNSDIDAMLKIIYEERGLTLRDMTFSKARDMIEMRKLFKEPKYYEDMITMSLEVLKEKYENAVDADDIIFYGYLYQEKKCFGLDYNDLLKFALYIFQVNEEVKLKWQKCLEYIMIDEFQDIDRIQYQLMSVLCAYHKNLFIVGDPDQTIYSWRGADSRYLLEFERNFPGTKTIMMMENYRSTPEILSVANSLVEKNHTRIKKDLIPVLESGKKVICYHGKTSVEEAEWIADEIEELLRQGRRYGDITILYRAHYVTRTLEEVFLKRELPYTIYSGVQFFNRMEIKDALSYLRMIAYQDDLSFARIVNVPKRNIGQRRMRLLQEYAQEHQCSLYQALKENVEEDGFKGTGAKKFIALINRFAIDYEERPISELISEILNRSEYEKMLRTEGSQERLDNLAELKQSIYEYETTCGEETTLESYLSHIALFTNTDTVDSSDKVKLMTVHAAKGLEFPNVFLCGMNEGVFPSRKTKTLESMEEERRLAFVAITRAKERLYLSESEGKNFDGTYRYPSRFTFDIDEKLLEFNTKPDEKLLQEAREYIYLRGKVLEPQIGQNVFEVGDRVRHIVFGEGKVLEKDMEQMAYVIKFDGINTTRRIAFRVKLEKVG
ncbi:MAG: UvrD-helicase domain-containing protein [Eubacterium sp.]|nr:UvrD-helicase domain-containing protein [Eubacterium sp.]